MNEYEREDRSNHEKLYRKWLSKGVGEVTGRDLLDLSSHRKKVVIWTGPAWEPWDVEKVDEGMAGSETWAVYLSREFVRKGYAVTVYNDLTGDKNRSGIDPLRDENGVIIGSVVYRDHSMMERDLAYDVVDYFISSRSVAPLNKRIHSIKNFVMIHDVFLSPDRNFDVMQWKVDGYACLSEWHRDFVSEYHGIPQEKIFLTHNGVSQWERYEDARKYRKKNQAVYSSSPDRGLYQLLRMLPDIRRSVPDFELIVCYGFYNWEKAAELRGDEKEKDFIKKIRKLMEQPGVVYKGRVDKRTLADFQGVSKVWLYPTNFSETFCITAVENGLAGNALLTTDLAALSTVVGDAGILLPSEGLSRYGEYPDEYREVFVEESVKLLTDEDYRSSWAERACCKMKQYTWKRAAEGWVRQFESI